MGFDEVLIKQTTEYVLLISGGKHLITPKQLSQITPYSTNQQYELRKLKKFPIPHVTIDGGRLVHYRLAAVVSFLVYGPNTEQQDTTEKPVKSPTVFTSKKPRSSRDFSHLIMARHLATMVNNEKEKLEIFHNNLIQYCDMKELEEHLQQTLPINKTVTKKTKPFKV